MISIILPSRQRPDKALQMAREWSLKSAGLPFEFIISLDNDDPLLGQYAPLANYGEVIVNYNENAVQAINSAALIASGDILMVASDDFSCQDNWVRRIEKACHGKRDFVLKTYDGIQLWLVTLPILDRIYYERFGYIYHPSYQHMYCDTEFSHVSDLLHRLQFRNDILFPHNHHSIQKVKKMDEVTLKAESTVQSGLTNYLKRCRKRFDLPIADLYGISKEGADHKRWMRQHGI